METKTDVIYARYSSELQRTESIQDQVRRCRDGLERKGISHTHFEIIKDEAVSGTDEGRPGFNQIKALIRAGRLGKLVVAEQSRLTRGDNAKSLIKDIVYQGGRFISIAENTDTDTKNWSMLVGINEIHHSRSNEDTAERVRGGQEGRVLSGHGSAGDFPYGYASAYDDPAAALQYHGRGPKPRKHVVIDEPSAAVVREVFNRFVAGESITSITRWLTGKQHEIPRIGKGDWHHQHVRRILSNTKYVGVWSFGKTTTVRDSSGKKKQVAARSDQKVTTTQRPELRIIEQRVWDKAQERLVELLRVYGMKPEHRKRGPAEHYRLLYTKTLLGGLVTCSRCGSKMIVGGSGKVKRMRCSKRRSGGCPMAGQLPLAKAEAQVLEVFKDVLLSYPAWLAAAASAMRSAAQEMAARVPEELASSRQQLVKAERDIENLVDALAGGANSPAIHKRLADLERAKEGLVRKVEELQAHKAQARLPVDEDVRTALAGIADTIQDDRAQVVRVLRVMLKDVVAEEVKIPGKKRGYARLRFRIDGWAALRQVLDDTLPATVLSAIEPNTGGESEEFVLDLGGPTRLDQLGPKIVEMRRRNVKWHDIARETGLSLGNAYTAYRRIVGPNQDQAA